MSHCIPCIGANRIQDAKSRKYILITFAVFVNRIQSYFIKILRKRYEQNIENDCYFMKSLGLRNYQSNCDNRQGIAKPYTIVILWTHSPVASKLGALHLKQVEATDVSFRLIE